MAKAPSSGTSESSSDGSSLSEAAAADKSSSKKRDTLISLRNHMDDISARLNQADTLTQQSVESLQNSFSVLEKRVSHQGVVNKAALTRRIDQLTNHLTGLIEQTRSGVAQDLRQAQINPTIKRIQSAVNAAENRLARAEKIQATALTKVNGHIADLARAIDARLTQETSARQKAVTDVRQTVTDLQAQARAKISDVENSSAAAITRLGEHVVALSQDFKKRTEDNTKVMSAQMTSIALKTQREFEEYQSRVERRMESMEENQRNLDSYMDRSLAGLATRIDNLEYGLTTTAPPAAGSPLTADAPIAAPDIDDAFSPDPVKKATALKEPQPLMLEPQHIAPQLKLVPQPLALADAAPAKPKPFMSPAAAAPRSGPATSTSTAPVEWTPDAYIPQNNQTLYGGEHTPLIQDITPVAPQSFSPSSPSSPLSGPQLFVASETPPFAAHHSTSHPSQNASDRAVADLIGADDLPYEDPAYAENMTIADMKRPGAFDLKSKSSTGGPKISKRNVRVGVMALLVATMGYFALRGFINRDQQVLAESNGAPIALTENAAPGTGTPAGTNVAAATAPAIGDYQDNQGVGADGETIVATTLEAAAESGDAVAEFQLGLSRLQSGQTQQAVKLIRASANKGQPAAQYRLAKLYEAGEGVTADASMARQLTETAATSGNRIAMHDLALYYAEGRGGVDTNIKTAAEWFEKAAQRGVVDSQYNLGVLYESGQGLPKNLTEAFVWYSIAAAQGDQFARKHIDLLKQQLSEADLKRAETRVTAFKPIALDEAANGIFKNVSWTQAKAENGARTNVEEAQTLLGQLGYNAGRPDGSMGPQTREAIVSFQKDQGLSETGTVDAALVIALQRASGV